VRKIQTKANGDGHDKNKCNVRLTEQKNKKSHKFHSEITAGNDVEELRWSRTLPVYPTVPIIAIQQILLKITGQCARY
jgi:hypothetical protein